MPEIKFPSKYLKINDNVFEGDLIEFMNVGALDLESKKYNFIVGIIPQGSTRVGEKKEFGVGPSLFKSISALYGTNSDNWVGKQMQVKKGTATNPKTGSDVDVVKLVAVGGGNPQDVAEFLAK